VITTDTVDCLDPPDGAAGFSGTVYVAGVIGGGSSGRVAITNSTLSGIIDFWAFDQVRIENSTVIGTLWLRNRNNEIVATTVSGYALLSAGVTVSHSILAARCFQPTGSFVASGGHNLASDDSCNLLTDPTDQINVDPMILPLADNGGPTPTLALAVGSPAIDAGGDECLATDQRGVARPQDGDGDDVARCDIGAYEYEPVIAVGIDIKPDGFPNSINPYARGVIPVAILGSDTFDVADIEVSTLAFGPHSASPAHNLTDDFTYNDHLQDVNLDGFMDLVAHVQTQDTGIACGDESASLAGETLDGQPFEGTDSIETVGCRVTRRPAIWMEDNDAPDTSRRDGPVDIRRE